MEASPSTNDLIEEIDNHPSEIIWKIEQDSEGGNVECEIPSDEKGTATDDDNDNGDQDEEDAGDEAESETEGYETGYILNEQASEEPPPKKRMTYQYEMDPRARKRHCKKLLQKLKLILDELSVRVGQQVAIIVAQPPNASVRTINTYGSAPLQDVIKRYHPTILDYLSDALARRQPLKPVDPNQFELPHLLVDGTLTPLDKMTQAQLREFIPLMIRYSTGRGKPGWGLERTRPPWWPMDVPWQNIRLDPRDTESKLRESWSDALRRIIIACYKYHHREDLLAEATGSYEEPAGPKSAIDESSDSSSQPLMVHVKSSGSPPPPETIEQAVQGVTYGQVVNPDGTISLYLPKEQSETETRQVILMDSDGREYCVQIAVPSNQSTVLNNFQLTQSEQLQEMPASSHVIGISN